MFKGKTGAWLLSEWVVGHGPVGGGWDVVNLKFVGVFKIILILTKGIPINYENLRGICEIFPNSYASQYIPPVTESVAKL